MNAIERAQPTISLLLQKWGQVWSIVGGNQAWRLAVGAMKLDLYVGIPQLFQALADLREPKLASGKVDAPLKHYP